MYSALCTSTLPDLAKKSDSRGATVPVRLCFHHMAGVMGGFQCAQYHLNGPQASANYYVGNDGDLCGGVPEELRAWTTASSIDYSSITFEISNDKVGDPWTISDATYNTLIHASAEFCIRYGIVPHFDGTKGGTIVYHQMFGPTACPGPTLINAIKSGQIENDIKRVMAQMNPTPATGDTIYRVQVGAFGVKDNAERYLATLQSQGYKDAFIVEGTK